MFTELTDAAHAVAATSSASASTGTSLLVMTGVVALVLLMTTGLKTLWSLVGLLLVVVLGLALFGGYELLSLIQHVAGS